MAKSFTFERIKSSKDCIITVTEYKRSWFGFGKKIKYVKQYRGHDIFWRDVATGRRASFSDELRFTSIWLMNKIC
jgi:hypothetical protein